MADNVRLQSMGQISAVAAVNSLSAPAKAADAGESAMSFGNALVKASDRSGVNDPKTDAPNKEVRDLKADKNVSDRGQDSKRENVDSAANEKLNASKKDPNETDTSTGAGKAVKDAAETVKEEIKEELGISEEELVSAMETLGLTLLDLLKGENIGELTAVLKGVDISEVVADESLYVNVQMILDLQREVTGSLIQDLNMTQEEFRNSLDQGIFETEAELIPDEAEVNINTEAERTVVFQDILKGASDDIASEEVTAGTPAETVKTSEIAREPDRQPDRRVEVIVENVSEDFKEAAEVFKPEQDSKGEGRNFGAPEERQDSFFTNNPGIFETQSSGNEFMENLTEAVSQTTSEFLNSYERVQDIMNQVRDQIRISINQETTTMEMQLNPESLGKVGLHIESKAGNITAQFYAQDESVRAALETQVADLRKSLEDQGVKVESVEVTLASREFESNFLNGENGQNGDNPTEEDAERTARLRRINLGARGDEEIPEEEMTEEEILNRRIMRENGSSIDFSA